MTRFPPPRDPVSPASIFTVTRSGSPRTVLESSRVLWQVEGLTLMGPCRDLQQCSGPLKVRMRNVQVCWSLRPQSKPPLSQPGGWRRGEEEDRGRAGEEISVLAPPLQAPRCIPLSPGLREVPSRRAQVGGQRRNSHRHLGAHQEESREGRKEGWWEGAREGGRREGGGEREERGRDGGETLKQRTEELGLAKGAGKGWSIEGVRRHLGAG